jgi:four helix bundle protein
MARTHHELIAWQLANELKLGVYALIETGALSRHPDLQEQLYRSASNAPRNIAEGFGRYLPGDFIRYPRFANGELRETYEALQDGCDRRCFEREQVLPLQRLCKRAGAASSALIRYLKTANPPGEHIRPASRNLNPQNPKNPGTKPRHPGTKEPQEPE